MGVYQELVDFDKLYHERSGPRPKIINDMSEATEEEKEETNRMIYSKYLPTDLLSNTPTCLCGHTQDTYNIGITCPKCNTKVESPTEHNLEPVVWMRKPDGIKALMHPDLLTMISNRFKLGSFDLIRYFADVTYKSDIKPPPVVQELQRIGFKRGYNHFVDRFDHLMDTLFNIKPFFKKNVTDPLQILIQRERHLVFPNFIPVPNRSLLIIEDTNMGLFVDPIIEDAIDAIQTIVSIDTPLANHTAREKENRTIKAIVQLAKFYDKYKADNLARKEGIFRKQVFGSRSHFACRAVASSITGRHGYHEIHLPWDVGVGLFREHLKSKLFRRGKSPREIASLLNDYTQRYHPLIDELFNELIRECKYPGIPVGHQRNPSLERASMQLLYVTKIKTDVSDVTASMSILSIVGFNADFDGDQLNTTLSLDNYSTEEMQKLAPHMSAFSLKGQRSISKNISLTKQIVAQIANWYEFNHPIDPVKLAIMDEYPDAPLPSGLVVADSYPDSTVVPGKEV